MGKVWWLLEELNIDLPHGSDLTYTLKRDKNEEREDIHTYTFTAARFLTAKGGNSPNVQQQIGGQTEHVQAEDGMRTQP